MDRRTLLKGMAALPVSVVVPAIPTIEIAASIARHPQYISPAAAIAIGMDAAVAAEWNETIARHLRGDI